MPIQWRRTVEDLAPEALCPVPDAELALAAAAGLGEFRWEGRVLLPSGEERFIEIAASDQRLPDGSVVSDGLVIDVTEHKHTGRALRESEEQYRRLVELSPDGIIIHRDRKILYVNPVAARLVGAPGPEALVGRVGLDFIHPDEHARVAERTRQLLAFNRKQLLTPRVLDLNAVVSGLEPMLRTLIGEDIAVRTRLGPGLGRVLADPGQREQVLVNLHPAGVGPGSFVVLTVSDAAHGGSIDLVLTDVVMPGMNGRALVEQLSATRPALRVLYMSGYTDDEIVRRRHHHTGKGFLPKPFRTDALTEAVWAALEGVGVGVGTG